MLFNRPLGPHLLEVLADPLPNSTSRRLQLLSLLLACIYLARSCALFYLVRHVLKAEFPPGRKCEGKVWEERPEELGASGSGRRGWMQAVVRFDRFEFVYARCPCLAEFFFTPRRSTFKPLHFKLLHVLTHRGPYHSARLLSNRHCRVSVQSVQSSGSFVSCCVFASSWVRAASLVLTNLPGLLLGPGLRAVWRVRRFLVWVDSVSLKHPSSLSSVVTCPCFPTFPMGGPPD